MGYSAFLRIVATNQGEIAGPSTRPGLEGWIPLYGFNDHVSAVYTPSAASGAGKATVGPVVIIKQIDQTSPQLLKMLLDDEHIKDWELRLFRPSPTGTEEHYFTIRLGRAVVVDIKQEMADSQVPELSSRQPYELVSFVGQAIEWTYEQAAAAPPRLRRPAARPISRPGP